MSVAAKKIETKGQLSSEPPLDLKKLKEPFSEAEVEFRLSQCGETAGGKIWGQCLAYITSRAIMDRLDDVCGEVNWKVSYEFVGESGVVCNLSILINGEWITKQDGAEQTNIESFKGGISSALKRAGSAWGIGRYLYSLESTFVNIVDQNFPGAQYGKTKSGKSFYWSAPKLPTWALPKKEPISAGIESSKHTVDSRKPSENQLKQLFAISRQVKANPQDLASYMDQCYGKTRSNDLTMTEYDTICRDLKSGEFDQWVKQRALAAGPIYAETDVPKDEGEFLK